MAEDRFSVDRGEINQFIEMRMGMESSEVVDVCNRWITNSDHKGAPTALIHDEVGKEGPSRAVYLMQHLPP